MFAGAEANPYTVGGTEFSLENVGVWELLEGERKRANSHCINSYQQDLMRPNPR